MPIGIFDLDLITLILKLGLDMVMMYLYTENEVPGCSSSKDQIDKQTHRPR